MAEGKTRLSYYSDTFYASAESWRRFIDGTSAEGGGLELDFTRAWFNIAIGLENEYVKDGLISREDSYSMRMQPGAKIALPQGEDSYALIGIPLIYNESNEFELDEGVYSKAWKKRFAAGAKFSAELCGVKLFGIEVDSVQIEDEFLFYPGAGPDAPTYLSNDARGNVSMPVGGGVEINLDGRHAYRHFFEGDAKDRQRFQVTPGVRVEIGDKVGVSAGIFISSEDWKRPMISPIFSLDWRLFRGFKAELSVTPLAIPFEGIDPN